MAEERGRAASKSASGRSVARANRGKKATYKKAEKNIYREYRSDSSVRFKVCVYPFPASTRTFDRSEEGAGLLWAEEERLRLKQEHAGGGRRATEPATEVVVAPLPSAEEAPEELKVDVALDFYEQNRLPFLASTSPAATRSRLRLLRRTLGNLTLAQLTAERLKQWQTERFAGKFGIGRSASRSAPLVDGPFRTKDQRYREQRSSERLRDESERSSVRRAVRANCEGTRVAGPSSQTVRHELVLLRASLNLFFNSPEWQKHQHWLLGHPAMKMQLPSKEEPRSRRVSLDEEARLMNNCYSEVARYAVQFALTETCRRGALLSLRWEDVDFRSRVIRLSAQGETAAAKLQTQDLPLTPEAVSVLRAMGPKKSGAIFPISPGSLSQAFRRAADRAGLPNLRLHDTRREAISAMADAGIPDSAIMCFSNHRSYESFKRHYLRPSAAAIASLVATRLPERKGIDAPTSEE